MQANDVPRARAVYKACLSVLPNKQFTFGKIWILAAHLEIRQKDLTAARKILGTAIGRRSYVLCVVYCIDCVLY
jgi:crooked neck